MVGPIDGHFFSQRKRIGRQLQAFGIEALGQQDALANEEEIARSRINGCRVCIIQQVPCFSRLEVAGINATAPFGLGLS